MIKGFGRIADKLPFLITLAVILLLAITAFVVINITTDLKSPQFYAELAFGIVLQVVMIATWVPQGKADGHRIEEVVATANVAQERMKFANDKSRYSYLAEFCRNATAENRRIYTINYCARHGIDYELWLSNEDYRAKFEHPEKTRKVILKAERAAQKHVAEIKDTEITSVTTVRLAYDTKNHTGKEEFWRLTAKIVTSVVTSLVGSFFLFENASFSLNGLMKFIYWLAIIGMTIFYSIRTGRNLISGAYRDYLLRMIDFINRYEAWLNGRQQAATVEIKR